MRAAPALSPLLLFALAGGAAADIEHFQIDPVHTRVAFQVSHAGFSNPFGSFSGVTGELRFDPRDWTSAELQVRIPLASLDLGDAEWQRRILDRDFFDARRAPDARFRSLRVERLNATRGRLHGELTLLGVSKPVTLEFTLNALKRHPLPPFRRTAGFSATGSIRRSDFGMDAWKSLVGDEVRLIIEAEAVRDHRDGAGNRDSNDEAAHAHPQ